MAERQEAEHTVEPLAPRTAPPLNVVCAAASSAVRVLHDLGYNCAVFGSLACKLYGNGRNPNDVDILVLTPDTTESGSTPIKAFIAKADPASFYLRPSEKPGETYQVLRYRHRTLVDEEIIECKVDILVPGTMHLPCFSPKRVSMMDGIPLAPFELVLLQKLQAWDDHGHATAQFQRRKQYVDAADIRCMLRLPRIVSLRFSRPWNDEVLFDDEFQQLTSMRVKEFCWKNPGSREDWRWLGFIVE